MAEIGTSISRAADLLRAGSLVAIPTETVYGLAGNAFDLEAVGKIFQVKNRPRFDPLIVHLGDRHMLDRICVQMDPLAARLAEVFWPGPLTLLLSKSDRIDDLLTAGSDLVAIRMPAHELSLALLRELDFPLAAPSANPFGYISPTTAAHVQAQLGDRIPYILDGGPCQVGLESTIVGFPEGIPTVYRKGGIPVEAVEEITGPLAIKPHSTSNPQAPGMLKSHYAPRTPIYVGDLEELRQAHRGKQVGILSFRQPQPDLPAERQIVLSATGDEAEAARHFFAALRQLDQMGLDCLLAEWMPERGLGRAINDRLKRAAAR